jgi:hypothetical protein
VYFDYNEPETQSVVKIAANVLRQLVSRFDNVPDDVIDVLDRVRSIARHCLSISSITAAIVEIGHRFSTLYLVVDGLHECMNLPDNKFRNEFLVFIDTLHACNTRSFITCRPHIQVPELKRARVLEIRAHHDDIKKYVRTNLENTWIKPELHDEIVSRLLSLAEGTYSFLRQRC